MIMIIEKNTHTQRMALLVRLSNKNDIVRRLYHLRLFLLGSYTPIHSLPLQKVELLEVQPLVTEKGVRDLVW